MASETLEPRRPPLGDGQSAKLACAEVMISIRSASERSGEYSRMGAATTSTSRASALITRRGTQSSDLDFFGQHLAHAGQRIARQALERFDGEFAHALARVVRQIGQKLADLAGELDAHFVIGIVGQMAIGMSRRRGVGGDRAAHFRRTIRRQIKEGLGRRIVAAGQFAAGGFVLLFENLEDFDAVEKFRQALP